MSLFTPLPFVIVPENHLCAVMRLGKFNRLLMPGFHLKVPFLDQFFFFDWRFNNSSSDQVVGYDVPTNLLKFDPPKLRCSTLTNLDVDVDVFLEFRINDVGQAMRCTNGNLFTLFETIVRNGLYRVVREMTIEELQPKIVQMRLTEHLDKAGLSEKLGLEVENVTVDRIVLPKEIQNATIEIERQKRVAMAELQRVDNERKIATSQTETRLQRQKAQQIETEQANVHKLQQERLLAENKDQIATIALTRKRKHAEQALEEQSAQEEQALKVRRTQYEQDVQYQRELSLQRAEAVGEMLQKVKDSGLSEEMIGGLAAASRQFYMAELNGNIAATLAGNKNSVFVPHNMLTAGTMLSSSSSSAHTPQQ